MTVQTPEQILHDKINLGRLVKRLDKSTAEGQWNQDARQNTWVKAQSTLQKVKYARKLLKNLELYELDTSSAATLKYDGFRTKLDRVEEFIVDVEKRTGPKPAPNEPLLPRVPLPQRAQALASASEEAGSSHPTQAPVEVAALLPTEDLLLVPAETSELISSSRNQFSQPEMTLISSTIPASSSKSSTAISTTTNTTVAAQRLLGNSRARQEELSEQLAQMATQLKRNALHFSESLAKDQAVVEDAQEKLEINHDVMKTERLRLKEHSSKSGWTTCFVMFIVLAVAVAFALMVFIIRLT